MKPIKYFISFLFLTLVTISVEGQTLSAEQVAQKAANVINSAKGLSVSFTLQGNGRTDKGALKSVGNKFNVKLPNVTMWYNGKELYTYNPKIEETTVIIPNAQELLESNPLLYVKNSGSRFSYKFSTVKRSGKYSIELTPIDKKNDITKMSIIVNASTFYPEKISVTTKGGALMIDIDSFKVVDNISDKEFEYVKSSYPKAEIIDLR